MRRADLEKVARRVARILGEKDCVLVGGLAVGAHGYVRATRDVDFIARVPLREARDRLKKHGIDASLSQGDAVDGDFPCLHGTVGGVRFDVMPPLVPLEWDRAIELPLGKRATLRVVDLDGLIRLKLRAGGPKDLVDVAALVLEHPEHRDRAREIAVAYRLADELDVWLANPRLRKELAEATTGNRREKRARHPESEPRIAVRGAGNTNVVLRAAVRVPRPEGSHLPGDPSPRRARRRGSG